MATTEGELLRKARKAADLSQRELASRIGVAHITISTWENSERLPEGRHEDCAEALGVDANDFRVEENTRSVVTDNIMRREWQSSVLKSELNDKVRVLLMALEGVFRDADTWAVACTPEQLAEETNTDVGVVEELWDELATSGYVEPLNSKVPGAFKLIVPK